MGTARKIQRKSKAEEPSFEALVTKLVMEKEAALARISQLEGLMDKGQLIGRPAARVALAAKVAHEVNRAYCQSIGDTSQPSWADAPEWQKTSAVNGVNAIAKDPTLSPQASHALWMNEKLSTGWVHGEVKDAETKTHPCMVPYDELPADQRVKDSLFGAAARAVLGVLG